MIVVFVDVRVNSIYAYAVSKLLARPEAPPLPAFRSDRTLTVIVSDSADKNRGHEMRHIVSSILIGAGLLGYSWSGVATSDECRYQPLFDGNGRPFP